MRKYREKGMSEDLKVCSKVIALLIQIDRVIKFLYVLNEKGFNSS